MADKLIFVVTCADEKADKATIPFALGNSALAMDCEAIIILQSTGVFLGKKGFARHIQAVGFPPLLQLMEIFKEEGGKLYACEPCIRARNIAADDLLDDIEIVSGPTLVDGYLEAKNVIIY
ncbi:MAG: DsrE family protein [Desulfobulbales bacterium]|nr:DsrE family protein [Desulfobulbales bacterium]